MMPLRRGKILPPLPPVQRKQKIPTMFPAGRPVPAVRSKRQLSAYWRRSDGDSSYCVYDAGIVAERAALFAGEKAGADKPSLTCRYRMGDNCGADGCFLS